MELVYYDLGLESKVVMGFEKELVRGVSHHESSPTRIFSPLSQALAPFLFPASTGA